MNPQEARQIAQIGQELLSQYPGLINDEAFTSRLSEAIGVLKQSRETAPDQNLMQKARMLWKMAKGNPQPFIAFLATYPDPQIQDLVNTPDLLQSVITKLKGESVPEIPSKEGITPAPLQSSNVWGFNYDPSNQRLFVRFNSGAIYSYANVPKPIWENFKRGAAVAKTTGRNRFGQWWRGKTPSLGAGVWKFLRETGIPYTRIK